MRKRHVKKWVYGHACIDFNTYVMGFIYCGRRLIHGRKKPKLKQLEKFEERSPYLQREKAWAIQWDEEHQDEQNNT